jgi:CelD/BcsL family acetyltransferase involved in cellulose biosynthesis
MARVTKKPTTKVVAGGISGAIVMLIVLILNTYVPFFTAQPISGEMASLATVILSAATAYLTPPGQYETTMKVDGAIMTARTD